MGYDVMVDHTHSAGDPIDYIGWNLERKKGNSVSVCMDVRGWWVGAEREREWAVRGEEGGRKRGRIEVVDVAGWTAGGE